MIKRSMLRSFLAGDSMQTVFQVPVKTNKTKCEFSLDDFGSKKLRIEIIPVPFPKVPSMKSPFKSSMTD